jgi:hypothetical protein
MRRLSHRNIRPCRITTTRRRRSSRGSFVGRWGDAPGGVGGGAAIAVQGLELVDCVAEEEHLRIVFRSYRFKEDACIVALV